MTRTAELERASSTDETMSKPYDVGRWCFTHDVECPYTRDHEVFDWYQGWIDASSDLIELLERNT